MLNFDDIFSFFRFWLATIVTVYASILTIQSLWGWYLWLAGGNKYSSLIRRYLLVHGLRLRFKTFWGDVIICILLCVAFFILWHAQNVINDANNALKPSPHVQRHAKSA
jgi:hypothetical protein